MAAGKWINDLSPTTPVVDAARRVLAIRLGVVREQLSLALREPEKDPEHVHQLRVGTRRAAAALRIFADCLPEKKFRVLWKQLRRLRRAAGAARDWDVMRLSLLDEIEHRPRRHQPALDFLLGYAQGMRAVAQETVEAAAPEDPFVLERIIADSLAALQQPSSGPQTLVELARPIVRQLLSELNTAASRDLHDYDHLHRVRILGKRLRYVMEVCIDCFDATFRERLYPAVEEMQEILGRANDSHVATQRLLELREQIQALLPPRWKKFKPGIEGLLKTHARCLLKEREQFLAWWQQWQRAGAETVITELVHAEVEHGPLG